MSRAVAVDFLLSGLRVASTDQPASGCYVYSYDAGTTTPRALYADEDKLTPKSNPFTLDSAGRALVYGEGAYKILVKDSANSATLFTWDDIALFVDDGSFPLWCGTTAGSSNTYTATAVPATASYTDGQLALFRANHTNTGAATLNLSGIGAKNIVYGTTPLDVAADMIVSGGLYLVCYETAGSGRWRLVNRNFGSMSQQDASSVAITGGTVSGINISGNITYAGSRQISNNTSDGSDSGGLAINGGGANGASRGADLQIYGNESAFQAGGFILETGSISGANGDITNNSTDGTIDVNLNGAQRWQFQPDGDLVGETSNGGNIEFNRDLRGVKVVVSAGQTATGTAQGDAAAVTRLVTIITSGALDTGLVLPTPIPVGMSFDFVNTTGSAKKIYPNTGHSIDGGSANAAISTATYGNRLTITGVNSTNWYVTSSVL